MINLLLMKARKRDFPSKLFYAQMREMTEMGIDVCDIGSTIEITSELEERKLEKLITEAHEESLKLGEYSKYGSSWGTLDLRKSIAGFFEKWGAVGINPKTEIMVSRGIIDSVQKVIMSLQITHVIIPSLAPFYAETFGVLKGKKIIVSNLDLETGNFQLPDLENKIKKSGATKGKVLMYITNPSAPAGTLMEDAFVENEFIPFLQKNGIWLISDSYISATNFSGRRPRPILSFEGAKDVAVEAITLSKELGLPSLRVGGMAGNKKIIEAVRIYAATAIDILPLPSQRLAAKVLCNLSPASVGEQISKEMDKILPIFESMNWPVLKPKAGIDMLIEIPPKFKAIRNRKLDPALLASFSILRKFNLALFPCSVFAHNKNEKIFFRLVLKQRQGKIPAALNFLRENGFNFETYEPSVEDIRFLKNKIQTLDLTKL